VLLNKYLEIKLQKLNNLRDEMEMIDEFYLFHNQDHDKTYLINVFLGGLASLVSSTLASSFNGSTLFSIDLVLFIIGLSFFTAFRLSSNSKMF
jgi:hypothetical protein